jgi:hypothetical protein
MGLLDLIFGRSAKKRTMYGDFLEVATPILISGYRRIAAGRGCAPGSSISDEEIVAVYQKVGTAFQNAARARGEILPATVQNGIVLVFLQKYQILGQADSVFFNAHISYEATKFQREGLREDYREELSLFDEPPLWYTLIPADFQCMDSALIKQLNKLRCEVELDHEPFTMAVMQSRCMTHRSIHLAYIAAKRLNPNQPEIDHLASVIAHRAVKKIETLPFNSSETPWTEEELIRIVDQAEVLAESCKNIEGVYHLAAQIEEDEGNFGPPSGVISRIDGLVTNYFKRSTA